MPASESFSEPELQPRSSGLVMSCLGFAAVAAFWLLPLDWILRTGEILPASQAPVAIAVKNAVFVVFAALWVWSVNRRWRVCSAAAARRADEAERRLAAISESGQGPFWIGVWEPRAAALRIDFANDAFFAVWGGSRDGLRQAGRSFFRRIHADERRAVEDGFHDLLDSRDRPALELECRVMTPDDSPRWHWLRIEARRDAAGRVAELCCVARDIDTWKQAEQARQESERLYRSLFDNSRDAIALCSIDGSFIDANLAFLELTGFDRSDLGHLRFQSLTCPSDREREERILDEQVWARGFSDVYEKDCLRKDGSVMTLSVRICHLRIESAAQTGFFVIARDAAAEKRHREELTSAKEEAESASEAKNRFLTVVSEELRTPLNPIIGYADLLLSRNLGDMERGFLEVIRESARHMSQLTSDIIEFARIESGESMIEETPFRVTELLNSVVEQMREKVEAGGNTLECQYHWKVSAVLGDKERIRKILCNLLSNAARFTKNGEIALSCGLLSGEGDEAVFRFAVRDSGLGIPDALKPNLFDPFAQASQDFGFDAGLSLAICRQLAESMNGRISVESSVGAGSTFFVDLPLPVVLQRENGAGGEGGAAGSTERQIKVLLVEDDAGNRIFAQDLLASLGCSVRAARDGEESLELLANEHFDLVLMDLGLPLLDGFETTSLLRAGDGPNRDVPIVALTARVSEAARAKCRRSGINDFLAKPVTCSVFEDVISRWTSRG